MATAEQIARLRADIGATETSLPTSDANDIFTEAGETYTAAGSSNAYARVIAIRRTLANAAKLTSYRQNATTENASDVFKHLRDLLALWQDELDTAEKGAGAGAMRFGKTTRIPARIKSYPGT